jgi:hypothetical protein
MSTPPLLYKYRRFGKEVLQELCESGAYFPSPELFNDPLDSKPALVDDLDIGGKEALLEVLHRQQEQPAKLGRRVRTSAQRIEHLRHMSTEMSGSGQAERHGRLLSADIADLFLKELRGLGVFGLAERWYCPLMWRHYAHQHAGLCLELSTDDHVAKNLSQVSYGGSRSIPISSLALWKVHGNLLARKAVLDTALLSKAPAWSYEREWRVVSRSKDSYSCPLQLTAIYFGERCPTAVQTMVVKTLHSEFKDLVFYDIYFDPTSFELRRREVDIDEVIQTGVRTSTALVFGREKNPILPPGAIPIEECSDADEGEPHLYG